MKLRLSLLLNALLLFGLIWGHWPILGKRYKQDGVWQLANPNAAGPHGVEVLLQIEDGMVVSKHDGCNDMGTDKNARSPFWHTELQECVDTRAAASVQNIRPFSVVEYDARFDVIFAPDHISGQKFIRKNNGQ